VLAETHAPSRNPRRLGDGLSYRRFLQHIGWSAGDDYLKCPAHRSHIRHIPRRGVAQGCDATGEGEARDALSFARGL
jgi:hypothetical protein